MKQNIIYIIACSSCNNELKLNIFSKTDEKVEDGLLICKSCKEWFPIISYIPRMLLGNLKQDLVLSLHSSFLEKYKNVLPKTVSDDWINSIKNIKNTKQLKQRTADSFAYEWNTFHTMCGAYRKNFLDFINPIKEDFFDGKIVLDAGSGVGRHTYWASKFGAKEVIGIDLSEAVYASYKNTKDLKNVTIIQADIYNLPFKQETFDYIFSIGVLHHLPNPEAGFQSLVPFLKKDGTYSIWVYGRRNNFFHVYFNESIRSVTRRIPFGILHKLCYIPALGVQLCNCIYRLLSASRITTPIARLIPFKVYAQFPFITKVNDSFDVFATPKSTYWKKEKIEQWYNKAGMKNYSITYLRKKSLKAYGTR